MQSRLGFKLEKRNTRDAHAYGEWKRAERSYAKTVCTQAWLAVSYLQISKRHPLYIFLEGKKKKIQEKSGRQKNGPIKHKSTVLHVFRARLARLSRLHRTEWRVPNAYLIFGRGAAESWMRSFYAFIFKTFKDMKPVRADKSFFFKNNEGGRMY